MTTSIKTCFKCGADKSRSEFYRHPRMADGLLGKCKDCTRSDVGANRKRRADYYRAYDRARGPRQTPADLRRYRAENPAKARAHRAVAYAVAAGKLIRRPCEICGAGVAHAHHDDYSKPLDVRWLCPAHHHQWHTENGEGKTEAA